MVAKSFSADDWAGLSKDISYLEGKCTTLARDLGLEKIETELIANDAHIQGGFENIQRELAGNRRMIEHQTKMQSTWRQTDEEREVLQLLRRSNVYETQKHRTASRVSSTCRWVLENKKYLDWVDSRDPD